MPDSTPRARPSRRARQASRVRSISSARSAELEPAVLPAGDLGRYLRAITLSGAPALNFPLWGLRRGADLYPLPITSPSALRPGWVAGEFARIPFDGVRLRRKEVEQLIEMLAPGPSRSDGLPYYRPDLWGWDRARGKKGRRDGIARRLAVAVASDVGDHDLLEISAKVLRPSDRKRSKSRAAESPKATKELRRQARRYWAQLGAWPWAHARRGKLPKDWRTQAAFLEPLEAWYERARRELDQRALDSMRAWSEGGSLQSNDLFKLPPEQPIRRVEPDEIHAKTLQRLKRRTASAEAIAEAGDAREMRGGPLGRRERG